MKIALVTTTISVPTVLEKYRSLDRSVEIIVAGDDVPNEVECDIAAFCASIDARYLSYGEQASLGYGVHDIIGRKSIQRRNLAILEAIKGGCDVLVSIDDDNEAIDEHFFDDIRSKFAGEGTDLTTSARNGWFDPGTMADQPYSARGLPLSVRRTEGTRFDFKGGKVGVVQGLVYGDPDCSATERIESAPNVKAYSPTAQAGVLINPQNTWSVINTQSTAWLRCLAPLAAVSPGIGRFDDIVGGWICQRIAADVGLMISYGPPFVRQIRHLHNLIDDLEAEIWGMRWGERFCDDLKTMDLSGASTILGKLALVYDGIARLDYMPPIVAQFGQAWVEDVGSVL